MVPTILVSFFTVRLDPPLKFSINKSEFVFVIRHRGDQKSYVANCSWFLSQLIAFAFVVDRVAEILRRYRNDDWIPAK